MSRPWNRELSWSLPIMVLLVGQTSSIFNSKLPSRWINLVQSSPLISLSCLACLGQCPGLVWHVPTAQVCYNKCVINNMWYKIYKKVNHRHVIDFIVQSLSQNELKVIRQALSLYLGIWFQFTFYRCMISSCAIFLLCCLIFGKITVLSSILLNTCFSFGCS